MTTPKTCFATSGVGCCPCCRRKCQACKYWRGSRSGCLRICRQPSTAASLLPAARCERADAKALHGNTFEVESSRGHCSRGISPNKVSRIGFGTGGSLPFPKSELSIPIVFYSTRASPLPFTTSPMSQALCFCPSFAELLRRVDALMNFSTASALSADTMLTMPIPMLKT